MTSDLESKQTADVDRPASQQRSRTRQVISVVVFAALAYFVITYIVLPLGWRRYEKHHPWLDEVARVTETKDGIPGDPLNVAVVGTEAEVKGILAKSGWHPADPLGMESDLRIAADTVLRREYEDAPVSNLYLFGRKEDLAYEQPVGNDPRRRHHVRFWRSNQPHEDGRPVWIGAVTYDERVGLSHTTGQITHHIAPDVDAERDHLMQTLEQSGGLLEQYYIDDFHTVRSGRNGGGDPWQTDGRLSVGVIRSAGAASP